MLRTNDLDYTLPEGYVATRPAEPRDSARLMVVSRQHPQEVQHRTVRDLPEILRAGDLVVLNTTTVVPAWLTGRRVGTGGRINGLFLREVEPAGSGPAKWLILLKGGHLHPGVRYMLESPKGGESGVMFELLERAADEPGGWIVAILGGAKGLATLEQVGGTPVPPYIRAARKAAGLSPEEPGDRERYQTVYADRKTLRPEGGSVAAPTAGLHFTPELLERLKARGVERVEVALHVGSGTFKPVDTEFVEQHPMHAEVCSMSKAAADAVVKARAEKRRVIAVGTTAARTLESYAARAEAGEAHRDWIETRLLITPGYKWRWTDGMLTNFHLPRSSLMAMVSAMAGSVETLKRWYADAIAQKYRFYSYGDAMLIL